MPWNSFDAPSKTHKANTPATRKQWADTANAVLKKSGDDAKAIRVANAAVKNHPSRKK